MPISKKRKKKGKKVKGGTRIVVDPNKESNITLQELINVLAYQEYQKTGVIDADGKIVEENTTEEENQE